MKTIKNYLYHILYNLLTIALPLITTPYLARILGKEGIGLYTYYFTIAQFCALIAKLGLSNYGTREISAVRENEEQLKQTFSNLYGIQILLTIIISCIYFGYSWIFLQDLRQKVAFIFGLWLVSVIFDLDWLMFGLEDFKRTVTRSTIIKLLSTICIFLVVKTKEDVLVYALITALSYSLGYVYLWIILRKYISLSGVKLKIMKKHFFPCLVLMLPTLAMSVYRSMDKVMLGLLSNEGELGLFEYAEKLIYCLSSFIASLGVVMMPKISHLFAKNNRREILKYLDYSMTFLLFLSSGMCFGMIAVADNLILLLYGADFRGSIILLALLSVTLIFISWGNVLRMQYIIPTGQDKVYIVSIFFGALLNLIINRLCIPVMGALGACLATVITEFSVSAFQSWKMRKQLPLKTYFSTAYGFILYGMVMNIVLISFNHFKFLKSFTLFWKILVGGSVYLLLCVNYFIHKRQDIFRLFSQWRRKENNQK
ncbi:hypothetical protein FACS189418_0840 [Clostridia bacterium]|nr:hypothetical protein FACS189418_0840 [Clostridia bacterium]